VPLAEVLAWQEQEWDILTRGRAGRRAKFEMWKRNARVLMGETTKIEREHGVESEHR
jgi:epoxyqueuosine reductase QueG